MSDFTEETRARLEAVDFGIEGGTAVGGDIRAALAENAALRAKVEELTRVAAAVAQWQGADSLSDCPACAVLDAALAAARGEEGK